MFRTHGKALVAVAIAAVTAIQAALSDGHITQTETVQITIAFFTAVSVFLVPAVKEWPWMKTAVAVLLAVLNLLVSLIVDGVSSADWTALVLAALTALGVGAAPAVSETRPPTPAEP
jgi:hypothetical protein